MSATLALALYTAGSGFSVTIRDPACEPHVVEVLCLLRRMGVGVEGEGTNRLTIRGPGKPLAAAEFEAGPDYVDIAGSITAAAVTGGELTIRGGNAPELIGGMAHWFRAFGIELEASGGRSARFRARDRYGCVPSCCRRPVPTCPSWWCARGRAFRSTCCR